MNLLILLTGGAGSWGNLLILQRVYSTALLAVEKSHAGIRHLIFVGAVRDLLLKDDHSRGY